MLKEKRLDTIMELLRENHYLSVNEIIKQTGIAKSTLRRDLFDLENAGQLIRARGGACLPDVTTVITKSSYEPPFSIRGTSNQDEKMRIAEAAMQFIQPGDTVILDSGTTTFELSRKIRAFSGNLMVATNDLYSAVEMSVNDSLELMVIGGQLRKKHFSMVGYITDHTIREMHADTAFISTDAVDIKHGLMTYSMQEVTCKRAMIDEAREVIALCDHTKFSTVAFVTVCSMEEIDRIITGKELDPKIAEQLENLGVEMILV